MNDSSKAQNEEVIFEGISYSAYQQLEKELLEARAIIQRQAELISWFINEYPQTKNLAEIKSAFEEVNHGKE